MKWDRLPFDPLEQACARAGVSLNDLVKSTGIRAERARRVGLSIDQADRGAHVVHCHPMHLWGDLYLWVQPWPEPEPGGTFAGRPLEYRAVGRERYYGLHEVAA